MNNVVLIGRLVRDGEYIEKDVSIYKVTVAVDRGKDKDGNDKGADFPRIVVFGRQADNCNKYLVKGNLVGVQGRIQTGSYKNEEGKTVYTTDIIADRVEFLTPKNSSKEDPGDEFLKLNEEIPF